MKRKIKFILLLIILVIVISLCYKNDISSISFINTSGLEYDAHNTEQYYGYLKVPAIDMNLGFYNYDSPFNDVESNIELIPIPVKNSYLFAAHSGVGKKAYFNDLALLKIDDDIILKIAEVHHHYKVNNIYRTIKDGDISIKNQEGMIYLTTCDQIIKGYQLVIEGILV